jgi:hypothetical protein
MIAGQKQNRKEPRTKIVVGPRLMLPSSSQVEVDSKDGQIVIKIPSEQCFVTISDLIGSFGMNLEEIKELSLLTGNPFYFKMVFQDGAMIWLTIDIVNKNVEFGSSAGQEVPWEEQPIAMTIPFKVVVPLRPSGD